MEEISMASGFVIRGNQYYDSVFLMGVNRRLSEARGVQQTAVLMGSETNKRLLSDIGIRDAQIDAAQPNDLIAAVIADTADDVREALGRLDEWLQGGLEAAPASGLRTLEDGLGQRPDANLAVISVPGEYATREARKALEAGLNVFLFSSNVSVDDELSLKQFASQQGLVVMGPDCGTTLIGGVGIGFANAVRQGSIGAVGASGTGLQEFTCQVHNAGFGISHAIGTGSHDLSKRIGGLTTFAALDALEADPQTEVVTLISKPPAARTLQKIASRLATCKKPVIGCFLGARYEPDGTSAAYQVARTIDEAVHLALLASMGAAPKPAQNTLATDEANWLPRETRAWAPGQQYLRGLFAGGTFCYQTQHILRDAKIAVHSNAPLDQRHKLSDPDKSRKHTGVDMGDDYYTLGRPHPMIDGTLRRKRILSEARDPEVAILLLDFILGFNASRDPVGDVLDAIVDARQMAQKRGGHLTVVASICGTEGDAQDLELQARMLREAGVLVFRSNARAAAFCRELLKCR
jgi:succinyl-CoA synthetase alpha subunit